MSLPNPKEIKKLAKACRESGIVSFKCQGYEFTLGDLPVKPTKNTDVQREVKSDFLTQEELLFYSVTDVPGENRPADS